jgi:hypothetical protein
MKRIDLIYVRFNKHSHFPTKSTVAEFSQDKSTRVVTAQFGKWTERGLGSFGGYTLRPKGRQTTKT